MKMPVNPPTVLSIYGGPWLEAVDDLVLRPDVLAETLGLDVV